MKDRILMTSSDDLWRHQYMTSSDVLLACNIISRAALSSASMIGRNRPSTLNLWRDDVIITSRDDSAFNLTQCSSINNAHMPLYIFMFIYFIRWPKEIKSQINQKLKNQKNWNRSKGHRKATRIRQLKHPMFIIITEQVNMDRRVGQACTTLVMFSHLNYHF